jgi:hypothetical protein
VKGSDGRRIGKSKKSWDGGRKVYDGIGLHAEDEQDPREVPDDYNPLTQLQKNVKRNQGKEQTKKVPALD